MSGKRDMLAEAILLRLLSGWRNDPAVVDTRQEDDLIRQAYRIADRMLEYMQVQELESMETEERLNRRSNS